MAQSYAVALDALVASAAALEAWSDATGAGVVHRLNRSVLEVGGALEPFEFDALAGFARDGGLVTVTVEAGSWVLTLTADAAPFGMVAVGDPIDAFDDDDTVQQAVALALAQDARGMFDLCRAAALDATVTLTMRQLTGAPFYWVATEQALVRHFQTLGWLGATKSLLTPPTEGRRVVVLDAEPDAVIETEGLTVTGPTTPPGPTSTPAPPPEQGWLLGVREMLPAPSALVPVTTKALGDVAAELSIAAHGLVWAWLAAATSRSGGSVEVTFEGDRSRELTLDRAALETDILVDPLELWRWTVDGRDRLRWESAQHAVTLVVGRSADLAEAAGQVRRTAERLHANAMRDRLAESLAARQKARDGAFAAARSAGDAARRLARSAVDRAVVQLVAAVGLLIANKANVVDDRWAVPLLLIVLGLVALTAVHSLAIEFPAAQRIIKDFTRDIGRFRDDALTVDDVREVRHISSLRKARKEIANGRRFVRGVLAAAALTVTVILAVVIAA